MITGIDVKQRIEFISSMDVSDPKTVFIYRPLSGCEMLRLSSALEAGDFIKYLDATIIEITNISPDGISKIEYLETIPAKVLSELMIEANKINRLTEQDAKN